MAIPTSRTKDPAEIRVNNDLCNGCGLCVTACSDYSLMIENGKAVQSSHAFFGCIGCGHCMAMCPPGAIEIHGRTISPSDLFTLPPKESAANYQQALNLLQRRRSIRNFRNKVIEKELAGESLGLGTCMLGAVHPLIQNGKKARKFRADHEIKFKSREGLFVIFGYPALKYEKGIRRTFADTFLV